MADENEEGKVAAPKGRAAKTAPRKGAALTVRGQRVPADLSDAEIARLQPADVAPAGVDSIAASGAIMEPGAVAEVDVDHPAVDNNPRADSTVTQNSIQFNDPTLKDGEAVKANLDKQG